MKMKMTPIADIHRTRLPQIGRIRMGKKVKSRNGKDIPTTAETWILTSSRPEALESLASVYGGTVTEWKDTASKDTHRLETESKSLSVILHPDGLQEPKYEKWDGGSCRRRCNGVVCTGYPKDESEPVEIACPCNESGIIQCKPKTHLNFMFPQTTLGFWRLSTGSFTAIPELFASAQVIQGATEMGFPEAELRIDKRQGSDGKRWSVPVLTTGVTMENLLKGSTTHQIEAPKLTELQIVKNDGDDWDEDKIEEAVVVEESDVVEDQIVFGIIEELSKAGIPRAVFSAKAQELDLVPPVTATTVIERRRDAHDIFLMTMEALKEDQERAQ